MKIQVGTSIYPTNYSDGWVFFGYLRATETSFLFCEISHLLVFWVHIFLIRVGKCSAIYNCSPGFYIYCIISLRLAIKAVRGGGEVAL